MRAMTNRADPAPSRWAYRLQRIMLTPAYRMAVRAGVPFCLSAGLVFGYMADEQRRMNVVETLADMRADFETRPQFMVRMMAVEGASVPVEEDIREVAQVDFPMSSFDLDLAGLQATISDLPAVAAASIHIRSGGVLEVRITERTPVVVWRTDDGLSLLAQDGVVVGQLLSRQARPDLPLVAGRGADQALGEAMAILDAAQPIIGRVRGLVRVGERRWNVVLDRNQKILLPENVPVRALERVITLSQTQEMLDRDLASVDMRLSARPTIRMNQEAVENWWKIKDIVVGADDE